MHSQAFTLAMRLLRREWRCGELRILVFALVVAIAATTTISFFSDRLSRAMLSQSAELIGGDLVVTGTRPLKPEWLRSELASAFETAEVVEFSTVAVHQQNMLLASVKAVSANYPLYGELRVSPQPYTQDTAANTPPDPGNAWVDARVLNRLNIKIGDSINIGSATFQVEKVLIFEPDRGSNFFNLAPRVLINSADLSRAEVLQPGSRADYKVLYAGADIKALRDWLEPQMGPGYRLTDVKGGRQGANQILRRTNQYLSLTSLLAIILAALAISVSAYRYSERHYDVSAMLRCLGATQATIVRVYLIQLCWLAVICGVLGCLLGWIAQEGLTTVLKNILRLHLPSAGFWPVVIGFVTGVVILLGTALPPVLRLRQVSPLRVMRRDLTPLPIRAWVVYVAAWLALSVLVMLLASEAMLIFMILAGVALMVLLLAGVTRLLIRVSQSGYSAKLGLLGRGLSRLAYRAKANTVQITAFAVTLMLMVVIGTLRSELLANWETQLPENVPNHFVFNVLPADKLRLQSYLLEKSGAEAVLYPMVRGRLVEINDEPVTSQQSIQAGSDVNQPDADEAIKRELNLSWVEALPEGSQIVAGNWWCDENCDESKLPEVSVEAGLAERLDIQLQDTLTFNVAGQRITAVVSSLRTVKWESFSPNFYIFFPPGILDQYPATYITSFRLADEKRMTLTELVREFPSITVLEVDVLIKQIQRILEQVGTVIELMLLFVLLAGFAVLLATIQSSLDARLHEGALMRALGASRRYLRAINIMEFALMGFIAGLLAVAGAEIVNAYLYRQVFDLEPGASGYFWLLVPCAAALLISAVGTWATRNTVRRSPMILLRQFN